MTRALIVVDVQESFRQHPGWATISNPGIVGQVNQPGAKGAEGAEGAEEATES
jgi:nicotinamidase-related amidase